MADDHERLRKLRERASARLGLFTTSDLDDLGLDAHLLHLRLTTGEWERMRRTVFRIAGHPPRWDQALLAAVLFHGDRAVASHRAAARLWEIPGFGRDDRIEVSKPRGRSQRKPDGWVHGSTHLPPEHVTVRSGIPVTDPARTIFDLAGTTHPRRAERALDSTLAMGLVTVGRLEAVFAQLAGRGRRGTCTMRELLAVRGAGYVAPTSELEALGRAVLADAGLPQPVAERDLGDADGRIGRVDLCFPDAKLVVELDSQRHHTALLDLASDRDRDNRLMASGWRVLRFTWWDLVERPAEVVAQVRAALAA